MSAYGNEVRQGASLLFPLDPLHFAASKLEVAILSSAAPGGKDGARKNQEALVSPRAGRATRPFYEWGSFPCRGDRRAPGGPPRSADAWRSSARQPIPADAFCARRPCLRATTPPLPAKRAGKLKEGGDFSRIDKNRADELRRGRPVGNFPSSFFFGIHPEKRTRKGG
jgi:hypothetical protein